MNTSNAAHKPSDLEVQYRGETRAADGYQYWTTSEEDEEALDIVEQVASGVYDEEQAKKQKKVRRKIFPAGTWRRTGIRLASMVLIAVLAGLVYFGITYYQVTSAAGDDDTRTADAIIVLGAAQYNGSPSNVLQERLDHAYNLYNSYAENDRPKIITTGAAAPGDSQSEGGVGYAHLIEKGVPESDIELIPEGDNSWEQLSAAAAVIDNNVFDEVLLVSDSYHNYRLQAIADELGLDAYVSPSAIEPDLTDYIRETAAVSIGRITGYRRLSNFTEDG